MGRGHTQVFSFLCRDKTVVTKVKNYAKADIKFIYPNLFGFLTLLYIFCTYCAVYLTIKFHDQFSFSTFFLHLRKLLLLKHFQLSLFGATHQCRKHKSSHHLKISYVSSAMQHLISSFFTKS